MFDRQRLSLVHRQGVAWYHGQLQEHGLAPNARDRLLARHHVHVIDVREHFALAQRGLFCEPSQQAWIRRWQSLLVLHALRVPMKKATLDATTTRDDGSFNMLVLIEKETKLMTAMKMIDWRQQRR